MPSWGVEEHSRRGPSTVWERKVFLLLWVRCRECWIKRTSADGSCSVGILARSTSSPQPSIRAHPKSNLLPHIWKDNNHRKTFNLASLYYRGYRCSLIPYPAYSILSWGSMAFPLSFPLLLYPLGLEIYHSRDHAMVSRCLPFSHTSILFILAYSFCFHTQSCRSTHTLSF